MAQEEGVRPVRARKQRVTFEEEFQSTPTNLQKKAPPKYSAVASPKPVLKTIMKATPKKVANIKFVKKHDTSTPKKDVKKSRKSDAPEPQKYSEKQPPSDKQSQSKKAKQSTIQATGQKQKEKADGKSSVLPRKIAKDIQADKQTPAQEHPWRCHLVKEQMNTPNFEIPAWIPNIVVSPAFCCTELELDSINSSIPTPHERRLFKIICYLCDKGNYVHRHSDGLVPCSIISNVNMASSDKFNPCEVQLSPNYPQVARPNFFVRIEKQLPGRRGGKEDQYFVGRELVDGLIRARPACFPLVVFDKNLQTRETGTTLKFYCRCAGVVWRFKLWDIWYKKHKNLT